MGTGVPDAAQLVEISDPGDPRLADYRALREEAAITAAVAEDAAIAAHPGARVISTDLDREAGIAVYDVELIGTDRTEIDVTIDAADGSVLDSRTEAADSDD